MHTLNFFMYSLMSILILSFDLVCADIQIATKQISNNSSSDRSDIAEGGVLPEKKEHVKPVEPNVTLPKVLTNINGSLTNHSTGLILVGTVAPVNKSDQKSSDTGKTNISNSNHLATSTTSIIRNVTSAKPVTKLVPAKPRITEHDEGADKTEEKQDDYIPKFPSIDALEKKSKRANYVIPIVGVILSVPLVAIIISVIYKRGADWWQHRNYRRMDFLIEGMYNN